MSCVPFDAGEFHEEPIVTDPYPMFGAVDIDITLSELSFTLTDNQGDIMDYYVSTNPNIGIGSNSAGVGNGTYSISVSDLEYDTTYTWIVSATDPLPEGSGNWTIEHFIFSTREQNYPDIPDGFNAETYNRTQINLSWINNGNSKL